MDSYKSIAILTSIAVFTISAFGVSCHVDSESGDEGRNGFSSQTPWKTLQKASSVKYRTGDIILIDVKRRQGAPLEGIADLAMDN